MMLEAALDREVELSRCALSEATRDWTRYSQEVAKKLRNDLQADGLQYLKLGRDETNVEMEKAKAMASSASGEAGAKS